MIVAVLSSMGLCRLTIHVMRAGETLLRQKMAATVSTAALGSDSWTRLGRR
jgi:hypothetical protein